MTVTSDQCSHRLGNATVRSRVSVRLRFPDGYTATADVLTFHGLADGKEHLLLGLGGWEQALFHRESARSAPLVRLHSECLTGDVFGSERCDCGPQLREGVEEIAATGGFLLYLRRKTGASACTQSSTPTRCRMRAWIPTKRTWHWAMARTSATTRPLPRCSLLLVPRRSASSATTRTRRRN